MNTECQSARFHRVLWPHRATVLRTARYLCRDQAEADDLAQEAFLRAFRGIDRLQDDAGALPWLMTILRNARVDRVRASVARPALSFDAVEYDPAAPIREETPADYAPETLLESLSDQDLIDALHELPENLRWTLLLVDVHGLDLEEAARIENIPSGTIKSRCHRARSQLRRKLLHRPAMCMAV